MLSLENITFWSVLAIIIVSAGLTVLLGYFLLPLLRKLKVRQTVRAEGPKSHQGKSGTPTMGGLIFIAAMLVIFAVFCKAEPWHWLWLFAFLAFGMIGFLDDMYKVVLHRNLGLTGKQKLVGQFAAAIILLLLDQLLYARGTAIYAPSSVFSGELVVLFDLGLFYYPIIAVFMVGMVNAVNLTDGLDGLASGVSVPTFFGFMIAAIGLLGSGVAGSELPVYAAAMIGGCLGFLCYNRYPAKVFMGDTGSMALGGAAVGFMLVMRMELLLIGFGLVYLLEALSVMLQVASFKLTGKRIFLMSPLHHHFELKGWKETKVTAVFCLMSAAFVCLTLILCTV